jgi:hypothetical protein
MPSNDILIVCESEAGSRLLQMVLRGTNRDAHSVIHVEGRSLSPRMLLSERAESQRSRGGTLGTLRRAAKKYTAAIIVFDLDFGSPIQPAPYAARLSESVSTGPAIKSVFIAAAIGTFGLTLRIDRRATVALLPSDAFSLRSATGTGLWMVWLLSIAYSPLAIYAPLFLQRLHGLSPLTAGYMVALASLAWTAAALTVASLSDEWPGRLIIAGPMAMAVGLLGVGLLMAPGPPAALLLPISLIGIGIGGLSSFNAS